MIKKIKQIFIWVVSILMFIVLLFITTISGDGTMWDALLFGKRKETENNDEDD